MSGVNVACHLAGGKIWLGFEALESQPSEVPQWCKRYFESEPMVAGPDNAYLILQWPAAFQLPSLPVPPAILARETQRMLVTSCTAGPEGVLAGEDIHCRYFAPQYGVTEDLATGSAMRVLAHYWQHRDLGSVLTAYQNSKAGGLLFSRIQAGTVW